jgi:hypothetical protein
LCRVGAGERALVTMRHLETIGVVDGWRWGFIDVCRQHVCLDIDLDVISFQPDFKCGLRLLSWPPDDPASFNVED